MAKPRTKILLLLLVLALLVMSVAGCAKEAEQTETVNAPEEQATEEKTEEETPEETMPENSWEIDTSPVTLKLFVDMSGAVFDKTWGQDPVSKKWIQDTGVNLEWEIAPDKEHTKLNVIIASGDFPDLMYVSPTISEVKKLAEYDKIWALNELAAEHAPNFMNNLESHMVLNQRLHFDSMNVYLAPFYFVRQQYMDSDFILKNVAGVTVLGPLYEELGSPEVKTTEDYLNLLRTAKEKYPDMIPVQSHRKPSPDKGGDPKVVTKALPMFGLSQKFFETDNGYIKYWEHPNFVEVLKFSNTLYNEGLIDKTEFTDKKSQLYNKLWSGTVFSEMQQDADNIQWYSDEVRKVKPDWYWIMIDPPTFNESVEYVEDTLNGGAGTNGLVVSKDSEYADRAIRWMDYLYQDSTQKEIMFGLEGQGHDMVDGLPCTKPEVQALFEESLDDCKMQFGICAYYLFRESYYGYVRDISKADQHSKDAFAVGNKHYKDLTFYDGAEAYQQNSEEMKIAATIKDYYETMVLKIVMAKPEEVEGMYETMMAKMKELGLDTLNAYWTDYFSSKSSKIEQYSEGLD